MSYYNRFLSFLGLENNKNTLKLKWKLKTKPVEPVVEKVASIIKNKNINYLINDPTTPDLIKLILPPEYIGSPKFTVRNYNGGGYTKESYQGQAASCFITVSNTINYINSKTDRKIPRWPGTSNLQVIPRAGVDLNAAYDRRNLLFFAASNPRFGGSIYTCDSTDIVAHELGHAILDAYRPEMWSAMSLEIASFHEAFADFVALMNIMTHDQALIYALNQTGENIRNPNVISKLAEQFGLAIYNISPPNSGRSRDYLRYANNTFNYVNPSTLPADAQANQLAAEPHSFGQIFLGAFYDILAMIYEDIKSTGVPAIDALKQSRDLITRYVLKSIQNAPLNARFYNSMAKTILWADVTLNNRKYHDRINQIFTNRNMVVSQLKMLSAPKCDNENLVLKIDGMLNLKLSDVVIRAQSDQNPLYNCEIEIPKEQIYLYDNDKNLYDSILITDEDSISSAQDMVNYLHQSNNVSDDPTTHFEIKDGKLIRTHFSKR